MEFCSEVVRYVEIPQSLSNIDHMSKITGNIILKDAVAGNHTLRVEGDLLWQGYCENNSGEEECLWEGAEFFQEELPVSNLRIRDPFMMEPEILGVTAEKMGENGCNLTFSVRWWEEATAISDEAENFEDELQEIDESFRETIDTFTTTGEEDNLLPEVPSEPEKAAAERKTNVTEVCNDFRELRKGKKQAPPVEEDTEISNSGSPCPPSPPYCLHFYRAKEGDTLETIAERFSTTISKMRGINELDEVGSVQGRMVRIN